MKIYDINNKLLFDVAVDDSSYRHRVIKGEQNLTLKYALAEHVELPVGAYCQYQGERYTLERPESFKMKHSRNFEYTVIMEAYQAKAKIWKFRNTVDGRLKFPFTAKPIEHLQMFVDNMNRRDKGWTVGQCIDDVEHLVSYDHNFCWDALGKMATEFKTEFEIIGKRVSLRKVEYNKSNPLSLAYGCGNGFKAGLGRSNSSDTPPVEILYVQGGTQNIDRSKYGNSELLLPKGQAISYDGEHFESEAGFNATNARRYIVDDLGLSIRRADKSLSSLAEDSLDCTTIYPKRVGTVSSVVAVDVAKNFYDIIDNSIPAALNYEDCLIAGETMTVIFQSGMLAGREFEVKYYHKAKTVKGVKKAAHRFEIVPQEIDGITMPNAIFAPRTGDTYAIFKVMLPQAYICDNATKTGAEWDMFKSAVKYLFDNEEQKFTFTGELDGIWAKKDWENIGGRIVLGGYILFRDERFQKDGVLVRITGIKDYINKPHSPVIEISNKTVSSSFSSDLKKLQSEEVIVEENHKQSIQFTKRRFRDVKETMAMLEQSLLENYTNSISPIAIQTMQLLVGDESLQFRFVANSNSTTAINHTFNYNAASKVFSTEGGIIQHMTLGIQSLSPSHNVSDYKVWYITDYTSAVLDDANKKYYLYIKAPQNSQYGDFVLSEKAIKMEGVSGYYHFLVGVLNSEYEGDRSFVPLYGFTEILPGRITTDRIVNSDGTSYFDMLADAFKLGNKLQYNVGGDGLLKLRGTIVQSLSGDESPLGCFRGAFNSSYTYYNGDEVTYLLDGNSSTYRYINGIPSRGHLPTETTYWAVVAQGQKGKGEDGKTGAVYHFLYTVSSRTPDRPTFTTPAQIAAQSSWSPSPMKPYNSFYLYMTQSLYDPNTNTYEVWTYPIPISGDKGEAGKDGTSIEFIYLRNTGAMPAKPSSAQQDGYIPNGWTNNPSGITETQQYEWVCVRTKPAGATTWSDYSMPAIWAKWGNKGQDGDGVEYIFKRTEVETVLQPPASVNISKNVPSGWSDNPSGVTAEYPYEYVSIRRQSNGVWGNWATPKMWANYAAWNANLLEQTEFENLDKMNKWDIRSCYLDGSTDNNISHISKNGKDGHNYYADTNVKRHSESLYKDVLRQPLFNSTIKKIQPSTWYTLSFWMRCGANNLTINQTSSDYGFAKQQLYLFRRHKYMLYINGCIDAQALSDGKSLAVYVYNDGWTWAKTININSTSYTTASIEFDDVPSDGEYHLSAYLYDNSAPRTGKATLAWVCLQDETQTTSTYVYPSAVDTVKVFIDGEEKINVGTDLAVGYTPSNAGTWRRHVITFKTKSFIPSNVGQYLLFRLLPTPITGQPNYLHICMPKLEIGKVATAYSPNVDDMGADYQEYRFAKNGSTTVAPSLNKTVDAPTGWTLEQPAIGKLEYLWMTIAKKRADGTLLTSWSEPIRMTPYDGKDGVSPALVFRGAYDSTKTYYGNQYRIDACKYGNTYYVCRVDAGEFRGIVPTDTSKWNSFGASFESIATNLLLAEGANIGDWFISQGRIVSTLESGKSIIRLDAHTPKIEVESTQTGGGYGQYGNGMDTNKPSKLAMDAQTGQFEARSSNNSVAYVSANGIFSNHAMTNALPTSSGWTHYGAIVGLGFGNVNKREWSFNEEETIIAGVYGSASNSGTAPAYGGYFSGLKARGFVKGVYYFTDNANNHQLGLYDTTVIGLVNRGRINTLYLPRNAYEGQEIEVIQMGGGVTRIDTNDGSHIYDDNTENDYYDINTGWHAVLRKVKYAINNATYDIWVIQEYHFQ